MKISQQVRETLESGAEALSLDDAESHLKQVNELKVRHTGKKSAVSTAMKSIGSVAPELRAEFGKKTQGIRKEIEEAISNAISGLNEIISYEEN